MTEADVPLRLDAPREEVLEHAAKLVAEAWQSFDRYRPEEPRSTNASAGSCRPSSRPRLGSAHEAVDDAARILDESIAQPRPRYFVGVGSSGLEIGTIGDLLAHTYDINLAVDARRGDADREAGGPVGGRVHRLRARGGGRVHERRHGLEHDRAGRGARARPARLALRGASAASAWRSTARRRCTTPVTRAVETLGVGSANLRAIPLGAERGLEPGASRRGDRPRSRGRRHADRGGRDRGHHAHRRDRSARGDRRYLRGARRVVPRRRRLRAAGGRRAARSCSRVRARALGRRRRPQVALPAEGLRDPPGAEPGGPRCVVRARAGVPAAPAARAPRDGHDVRVLPAVPRAEVLARDAGARGRGVRGGDRTQPVAGATAVPDGVGARAISRRSGRRSCRSSRSVTRRRASSDVERTTSGWPRRSRPTGASGCRVR